MPSSARTPNRTLAPSSESRHPLHRVGGLLSREIRPRPDPLALDILGGRAVPPAVFVKHQIITRENVDHFYPNDGLMGVERYARF